MKKLLLTSTAMVFAAGMASAQATTTNVGNSSVSAQSNTAATASQDTGSIFNEALALDTAGGGNDDEASATAGESGNGARGRVNLSNAITAQGQTTSGVSATVAQQAANANLQFQVGNNNQAINMQSGNRQESATVQEGDENDAIISQTNQGNEAAIAQLGNLNQSAIFQDGFDNAAATAQVGENNSSIVLQDGDHNIAANSQFGNNNAAMTFQNNGDNTAAQVQVGDDNMSFISQGGGDSNMLSAIDGTMRNVAIPAGLSVTGAVAGAATLNSAASIQLGTANKSAIIQQGNNNQAVNYQSN